MDGKSNRSAFLSKVRILTVIGMSTYSIQNLKIFRKIGHLNENFNVLKKSNVSRSSLIVLDAL